MCTLNIFLVLYYIYRRMQLDLVMTTDKYIYPRSSMIIFVQEQFSTLVGLIHFCDHAMWLKGLNISDPVDHWFLSYCSNKPLVELTGYSRQSEGHAISHICAVPTMTRQNACC